MKSLTFGIVLILVIGIGGFAYRYVMEQTDNSSLAACTKEAKICPDGSSVSRTGPLCDFTLCPLPNIELTELGISFVLPPLYSTDEQAYGADPSMVGAFIHSVSDSVQHSIIVRRYLIEGEHTAEEVILAHTRYQPRDERAEDFSDFETKIINGQSLRVTVIERFEGVVHSAYFLERDTDVLMFEIIEQTVDAWTDPELVVDELPQHAALHVMLATLHLAPPTMPAEEAP